MKKIVSTLKRKKVRKDARKAAEQIDRLLSAKGPFRPTSVRVESTFTKVYVIEGVDKYQSSTPRLTKGADNPVFRDYLSQELKSRNFQQNGVTFEKKR